MRAPATLVVLGMMGHLPVAGVTWQFLQYLEGSRRLGFATYYVEDTDAWPYDPDRNTISDDPTYAVRMLGALMREYGFADRWAYRAVDGRVYGLAADELDRVLARADALVNVTGSTVLREAHRRVPVRIYLETDPVLPQIELAKGQPYYLDMLGAHTHHFTYGENIGQPDCGVPVTARFPYRPTRPPIVLEWWTEPGVAPGPGVTASCLSSRNLLSMSRIRMARVPSANATGLSPGVAIVAPACLTRASIASRSRTMNTTVAVPGSWIRKGIV